MNTPITRLYIVFLLLFGVLVALLLLISDHARRPQGAAAKRGLR